MKVKRKFLSQRAMAILKGDEAALNGQIKRGERKGYVTFYSCGCSNSDCAMVTVREVREKESWMSRWENKDK